MVRGFDMISRSCCERGHKYEGLQSHDDFDLNTNLIPEPADRCSDFKEIRIQMCLDALGALVGSRSVAVGRGPWSTPGAYSKHISYFLVTLSSIPDLQMTKHADRVSDFLGLGRWNWFQTK